MKLKRLLRTGRQILIEFNATTELQNTHKKLVNTILQFEDSRLEEIVPSYDYTVYVMLHGVIQHDFNYAGQIALLKKNQV